MNTKPFSFSDAFEKSFQIYADHFKPLFILSCLVLFPLGYFSSLSLMLAPASFGLSVLFFMMLIDTQSQYFNKKEAVHTETIMTACRSIWIGLGSYLLFFIIVALASACLLIPGIYWGTMFGFFIFVQVIEEKSLIQSFRRSNELVRTDFRNVLKAHGIVLIIIGSILLPIFCGLNMLSAPFFIQKTVLLLLSAILLPFLNGFYCILFNHLRREKDGQLKIHESLVTRNTP